MHTPHSFIANLPWRFATKRFDTEKKVAEEDIEAIERAIRYAPSSFGVQPYHIVKVTNPALRQQLRSASFDQSQVTDAEVLYVFLGRTDLRDRVDAYVSVAMGEEQGDAREKFSGFLHSAIDPREGNDALAWSGRQAYIALGFGLAAAAELGVDACPMEGFDPVSVGKLLELPPHMHALAYMAVGHRKEGPTREKVRFPHEDLFTVRA